MENLLKKMNEKIDSQNRKIESQSEILQEFIGLLNAKQREGEDFEKFLRELSYKPFSKVLSKYDRIFKFKKWKRRFKKVINLFRK